ncbi:NeuD_NnaD, sugar O-acyltransferase, sialic acid O-acetyltransferase NeuD family [uncultured Caudovirales phage]|uniref:NeuD_NnaD, sugar O-acyltransferase, sialic acid O-acetyltransferase NeuD family n=1 Tax=uncultured Caudovirales phage TaxID=2100421 RepID=A0A6J5LH81_9CAUD|nr:NeuD_NnaD, sugar O-acyltransferase, sialic acid O-acetyltransferase NeuD family [uncultured Caudovirales phage]
MVDSHINDTSKPLIFLGSNIAMEVFSYACENLGIEVYGIMDNDYYGNMESYYGIPVIDTEESLKDTEKLQYYRDNFNFFCASNWIPTTDAVSVRNRLKRDNLINLIESYNLNCISIIDSCAKILKSTKIGRGCFIDGYINILPRVTIGDYTNIYTFSHVGHDTIIGKNCVIQRYCAVPSDSIVEDNVFFGSGTKALKDKTTYKRGTFIHEGIYLRRGTVENEVVSMYGTNTKRVVSQYVD